MTLQHEITMEENLRFSDADDDEDTKAAEVCHYLEWPQVLQTHW